MKNLLLTALLTCSLAAGAFSQRLTFSPQEVADDMDYLVQSLHDTHYNLYAYTDSVAFWQNYREVKQSLSGDSIGYARATSLFQRIISMADNGHTEIDFPVAPYIPHVYGEGSLFPVEVAIEHDKAIVREAFIPEGTKGPAKGDELLTIEGEPVFDLIRHIQQHISAERPYFKNAKFELFSLPRLYWQHYGVKDIFHVTYIDQAGDTLSQQIPAVKALDYEMNREGIAERSAPQLTFYDQAAYLSPGPFAISEGWTEANYQAFIDSAFQVIKAKEYENLIIDLRNHPGGDNSFSDYLTAYIADKPFRWYSDFRLRSSAILKEHTTDTTGAYGRAIHAHEDGEVFSYDLGATQPVADNLRYTGNVYVLVNRQSHSMSTVAAATIKDYGFGKIVGEETGEYPSLMASQFGYALPNTGIIVKLSKGYMVRPNGNKDAKGLQPDILIRDHLLDTEQDDILEGLLERLSDK